MSSIRKQLGLDYLRGAEQAETPRAREEPPYLDDALISYGRPVLEALRRNAPATTRLYALIDELNIPIEMALRVTEYLEKRGHLRIVQRDLKGDHELQLTEEGRKLLG
jgi:predicted transcriptional regulator